AWDYRRATRIPERLVREMSVAQSNAVAVWTQAREANDFARFQPHLERLLDLKREEADCLKEEGQTRYDALLDGYERGMTGDAIETLFAGLRDAIAPLVQQIADSPRPPDLTVLGRSFGVQAQWDFGMEVLGAMGFDFDRGRQDKSAHPFTTGLHPSDVRITTRLSAKNLASSIFSTIHEGGHALYEQGLREEDWGTPLGSTVSLGINESQSRMWENLVGRGLSFWTHFFPKLRSYFPIELQSVDLETFYRAINHVRPSLIRVEADEATYSLHIILRFELERALLDGDLAAADLPEAWGEKMQEYLGIVPTDDKDGCMQDIHWAWGLVGYFPTYALGNLYSAQFFDKARRDIGDLDDHIARGNLGVLTEWLRENIHRRGHRLLAPELVEAVTGEPLRTEPFLDYLKAKYSDLYLR
ncbi:carboxypeptidase M32, partial [bacterium]|nr:carboxypeptidase M32 [bacterium]